MRQAGTSEVPSLSPWALVLSGLSCRRSCPDLCCLRGCSLGFRDGGNMTTSISYNMARRYVPTPEGA